MPNIAKVGFNSVELAKMQNKNLMSIRLNDGASAKVLWNDKEIDCFIVKKGQLLEAKGERCNDETFGNKMSGLIAKLQKIAAKGEDVSKQFTEALLRNVK